MITSCLRFLQDVSEQAKGLIYIYIFFLYCKQHSKIGWRKYISSPNWVTVQSTNFTEDAATTPNSIAFFNIQIQRKGNRLLWDTLYISNGLYITLNISGCTCDNSRIKNDLWKNHWVRSLQFPSTLLYHSTRYRTVSYIFLYSIRRTGCETWSLTLRVEIRLRVFENRVLRRICGPKRDPVTGEWNKTTQWGV